MGRNNLKSRRKKQMTSQWIRLCKTHNAIRVYDIRVIPHLEQPNNSVSCKEISQTSSAKQLTNRDTLDLPSEWRPYHLTRTRSRQTAAPLSRSNIYHQPCAHKDNDLESKCQECQIRTTIKAPFTAFRMLECDPPKKQRLSKPTEDFDFAAFCVGFNICISNQFYIPICLPHTFRASELNTPSSS